MVVPSSRSQDHSKRGPKTVFEFEVHSKRYPAKIQNLSRTGVLFHTDQPLEVNSEILIYVKTPTGDLLKLVSYVVRQKQLNEGMGYAVGAKFSHKNPEDLGKIDLWVANQRHFVDESSDLPLANVSESHQQDNDESSDGPEASILAYSSDNARVEISVISIQPQWILVDTVQPLVNGQFLVFEFRGIKPSAFRLKTQVVKTQKRSDDKSRVGLNFIFEADKQKSQLIEWIAYFSGQIAKESPPPETKFVQSFLNAPLESLVSYFTADPPDLRLRFVGVLSSYEKEAFNQNDEASICFQKLVMLRAKCGLYHDFIPTIQSNVKVLGDLFLKILSDLFTAIALADQEIDTQIRSAVEREDNELRQSLNASSNQLHDVKAKMLFRLERRLSLTHFAQHTVMKDVIAQVDSIRRLHSRTEEVKYSKKEAKIEIPEESKSSFSFKVSKKVKIGLALSFFVFIVTVGYRTISNKVSVSNVDIGITVSRAQKIEDGIEVFCVSSQWERLRTEDKLNALKSIEQYIVKERLRQGKVLGEKGQLLAATAVILRPVGKPPVFARRIPKVKSF